MGTTNTNSGHQTAARKKELKTTYILFPHWGALFFVTGGAILIPIGLLANILFGLSAASDRVFAVEALISGLLVDLLFRRFLGRKLVAAPKVEIPFVYLWPILCLYVFFAQPLS